MDEKRRLYIDMDGTLTVFTPVDQLERLYEPGFFGNAKPIENVVEAVRDIIRDNRDIEVNILSAFLTDSQYAKDEKNHWLDKYLPEIDATHRIFVPCGADKKEYIPGGVNKTDYLLDDYTHNLTLWEPPAKGIKLLNGINHTRGTWKGNRLRFDKIPSELAEEITKVVRGTGEIRDEAPGREAEHTGAEPEISDITLSAADMSEYDALKIERPGELLAFQVGGYCLLLGDQAETAAPLIGTKLRELDIPGRGTIKVTGFRVNEWQLPVRQLCQGGHDVAVLLQSEPGQRRTADIIRKAADTPVFGRAGYTKADEINLMLPETADRVALENMVKEFDGVQTEDEILKNAAWFDAAAGVHNVERTDKILHRIFNRKTEIPAASPKPEKKQESQPITRQDVINTTIRFYDTKKQAKRLMLVADLTENNEYVCFNITSAKPDKENGKYEGNVFIPKSAKNRLRYDSYVKCDVEYIIAKESLYTETVKTPIRLNDTEFKKVMARYELLKAQKQVQRVQNTVEKKNPEFEALKAQVVKTAEEYSRKPELVAELIDFRAKFYKYSLNNTILIKLQNPYATYVASFKKWQELGYKVKKGEHGIKIFAPYEVLYYKKADGSWGNVRNATRDELTRIYKNELETTKKTYFTAGYVFDISQTTCPPEDYPKLYDMGYQSVDHAVLYENLKKFAEKSGFPVKEDKVDSIALKGFYRPSDDTITINDKLKDSEKLAVLTHELSHAVMHKTSTQPKAIVEFEAECLSHMMLRRLNIPLSASHLDYIATYYGKIKDKAFELEKSFQRISKAFNHVTEGFDRLITQNGTAVSHSVEKKQELKVQASPDKVNENFLQGIE